MLAYSSTGRNGEVHLAMARAAHLCYSARSPIIGALFTATDEPGGHTGQPITQKQPRIG